MTAPFTNNIPGPVITNSLWEGVPTASFDDTTCGYIDGPTPYFDLDCDNANAPTATPPYITPTTNERFLTHTYIMGFQFNPSGTYELAASVLSLAAGNQDEALASVAGFTVIPAGVTSSGLTGPHMLIDTIGSQLAYIKVGIVITMIVDPSAGYPTTGNTATTFQYAGVYMAYSLWNTAQPVVMNLPTGDNQNYFTLLTARHQIYGLSSFWVTTLDARITVVNYDVTVGPSSSVIFQTDNVNNMNNIRISADQWSNLNSAICSGVSTTPAQMIVSKVLSTVPGTQNNQQTIYETTSALTFNYYTAGSDIASDPLLTFSTSVTYSNILNFEQIVVGAPYRLDFGLLFDTTFTTSPTNLDSEDTVSYSIKIEGNEVVTAAPIIDGTVTGALPNTFTHPIGYIFTTTTPQVEITITIPRLRDAAAAANTLDRTMQTSLSVEVYSLAYDPANDCCVTTCPADNGIILPDPNSATTPPICYQCTAGLFFNSVTRQCECQTGYYQVTQALTNEIQCFPCFAPLCQTCQQATRDTCDSCVTGATVNTTTNVCECNTGFFQNGAICTACPSKCSTCTTATLCVGCADLTTRDATNNCVCNAGFYEAGTAICSACPTLCLTCSAATVCTSCRSADNRALVLGQCVCATGFFQVINADGTFTCSPCASTCTTCSLTADRCTDCAAAENRILGYDASGNQVCNCISGYHANSNGQCIQSSCSVAAVGDYCASCLSVLGVSQCIQCIAGIERVLVLPQQTCECRDGFYQSSGICLSCGEGCAKCNATHCLQCVASATNVTSSTATCKCPDGFFFTTSPIRYCKRCPNYTLTCTNSVQALTCVVNFALVNGACTCPTGNYINSLGQCMPCVSGCTNCNSSTTCLACQPPLLLQNNQCVSRCGPGYYQNGFVCTACSAGCAMCKGPNICLICLAGQNSYNGFCYNNCPAGSVKSSTESTCI